MVPERKDGVYRSIFSPPPFVELPVRPLGSSWHSLGTKAHQGPIFTVSHGSSQDWASKEPQALLSGSGMLQHCEGPSPCFKMSCSCLCSQVNLDK